MNPLDTNLQSQEWHDLNNEKQQLTKKIQTGIVGIVVLVLLHVLALIQLWNTYSSAFLIGYTVVAALIYFGCIGYVNTNAKMAMTVPLVVMLVLHVFWALVHPGNLLRGILYKIIIGILLFRARHAADQIETINFSLEQLEKFERQKQNK